MTTILTISHDLVVGSITYDEYLKALRSALEALTDDELYKLAQLIMGWGRPL